MHKAGAHCQNKAHCLQAALCGRRTPRDTRLIAHGTLYCDAQWKTSVNQLPVVVTAATHAKALLFYKIGVGLGVPFTPL